MSHMDLDVRPGTASVKVTDLGWQGLLNPFPLNKDEDDDLEDECLTPAKLRLLTGVDDLQEVTTLQMCVNTRENSLGNFGSHLPNLRQLKLNNSILTSVRDLGTSLSQLQVLWLAQCGLTDLDGIASLCSLKELYLAYNDLTDLSELSMLENLEVLDLEGNNLEQIKELQYLALCSNLTTLTLEGNPICTRPSPEAAESPDYNYRADVRSLIPHLRNLDDAPVDQITRASPCMPSPDWLMVKDYIKESTGDLVDVGLGNGNLLRKKNQRPATAQPALTGRPHSAIRPASAVRPATSDQGPRGLLLTESIEDKEVEDEASDLTHGVGRVICGNPIKALRARKEKFVSAPVIPLQLLSQDCRLVDTTEAPLDKDHEDVFAELRAWREKHNVVLQRFQEEHTPQILTITHSEEEEDRSASSEDEELKECWDSSDNASPSPLPQSPSDSPHPREKILQDSPLVPSPPITPCPPVIGSEKLRTYKGADIRVRRLLKSTRDIGYTAPRQSATHECIGDEVFPLTNNDGGISRTLHTLKTQATSNGQLREQLPPGTHLRSVTNRPTLERNSPKLISHHQPVIRSSSRTPETPSPPNFARPIAAKGVLQRLPNRPTLLLNKTSSS
ncbi:hypothetical protein XENTR_v10011155 [Xenopus tropicalis]|uniref:Leucine-rich repeat-containing 56 n=1 Tax=Xenopus tropicalis TaxID=8364 RepID=A0A803K9S8_XENTR|nr:leucine-rich repeat-containing protein 56 isoform X2 [Xenopus tropicalis]KAE8607375.1 hypothetical protein XENTR_v10011155 [Xenopus tropicalis]|eukprot:XP_012817846.1 PREDICTED: leucine-rich repeat-containing protein 56 isoform X2 [Xenopus tropicalis]